MTRTSFLDYLYSLYRFRTTSTESWANVATGFTADPRNRRGSRDPDRARAGCPAALPPPSAAPHPLRPGEEPYTGGQAPGRASQQREELARGVQARRAGGTASHRHHRPQAGAEDAAAERVSEAVRTGRRRRILRVYGGAGVAARGVRSARPLPHR